jgi:branched-chain amino acid transport system ATP-binding protein
MTAATVPFQVGGKIALELQDVRKSFGDTEIIRGVSLALYEGERHAVIGPNGAGKSTLFHLVSGLIHPTQGQIKLNGQAIHGLEPNEINRMGLARSFQITTIFPGLSVFENLRFGVMRRYGLHYNFWRRLSSVRAITRETDELLQRIRLE